MQGQVHMSSYVNFHYKDDYEQRSSDNSVTRSLVVKVAEMASIRNFDSEQMDVYHRLWSDEKCPYYNSFYKKGPSNRILPPKKTLKQC